MLLTEHESFFIWLAFIDKAVDSHCVLLRFWEKCTNRKAYEEGYPFMRNFVYRKS